MSKKADLSEWQIAAESFKKKKLKEPIFITTDLTLDDADILLEENDHNRNFNERVIGRYVKHMNTNNWLLNGETIKITADGMLLDGQHRLMALQKSNLTKFRTAVSIGVDPKTFIINDTGKSRDASDILHIAGYKNVSANAAAMRYMLWYQDSESFSGYANIVPSDVLDAMNKWPHMGNLVYLANDLREVCTSSVIQFFIYVTQTIDEEKSLEFFEKMQYGENLGKTSPILQLRKLFIRYRRAKLSLDKRHVVACLILTWNAFYTKKRVETVKWSGVDFPVIAGVDRKKLFKKYSSLPKK